jgi:predicted nucleotidyltransferase
MRPSQAVDRHRADIRKIVQSRRARNPRVFGSVARGDDSDESDVDILVDPTETMTLFDIGGIQFELERLLGVRVDVATPRSLSEKFRAIVLAEAKPV